MISKGYGETLEVSERDFKYTFSKYFNDERFEKLREYARKNGSFKFKSYTYYFEEHQKTTRTIYKSPKIDVADKVLYKKELKKNTFNLEYYYKNKKYPIKKLAEIIGIRFDSLRYHTLNTESATINGFKIRTKRVGVLHFTVTDVEDGTIEKFDDIKGVCSYLGLTRGTAYNNLCGKKLTRNKYLITRKRGEIK